MRPRASRARHEAQRVAVGACAPVGAYAPCVVDLHVFMQYSPYTTNNRKDLKMSENTQKTLADIAKRVRALLAKTQENGATEAEAMAAAKKARQIMDAHNLTLDRLTIEREQSAELEVSDVYGGKRSDGTIYLSTAVADFCDCTVWTSNNEVFFLGVGADASFAHYLFDALVNTCRAELRAWRNTSEYKWERGQGHNGRALGTAFTRAFVGRVNKRLNDLRKDQKDEAAAASRALVPVKTAAIQAELSRRGIRLRSQTRYASSGARSDAARAAGRAAGDRASFNRGVGGQSSARLT